MFYDYFTTVKRTEYLNSNYLNLYLRETFVRRPTPKEIKLKSKLPCSIEQCRTFIFTE